jgi:hypothetical protein
MQQVLMLNWFKKDLNGVLNETKTLKIKGLKFVIKKINVLDHLDGSRLMLQSFDLYAQGKSGPEATTKKIQEHYSHVLCAGVVHPRLHLKEGEGIKVSELFHDFEIANKLYEEIYLLSYGKKKA